MGSLLISHTTCLNWYDRLANFNTSNPCFDQLLMINEQFYEKSGADHGLTEETGLFFGS